MLCSRIIARTCSGIVISRNFSGLSAPLTNLNKFNHPSSSQTINHPSHVVQAKKIHVEPYNKSRFEHHQVVPDVIDIEPKHIAEVDYAFSVSKVGLGNILTPTNVRDIPSVHWVADPKKFYTLCMTDPDAPSRLDPIYREWHHWLVVNIPGDLVAAGEILSEYIGAGPPKYTGFHRYVFLIYEQPGKITTDEPKLSSLSGDGRGKFSIKKFAQKYKLGQPVAGNFFQAEWDQSVPRLFQKRKVTIPPRDKSIADPMNIVGPGFE